MSHDESIGEPLFIAEISGNHNGSLDRALEIVDAMAAAGAGAIKIQTYTADTITLDVDSPAFRITDGHELWSSRKLYDLYQEAHTPWEWHKPIFDRANQHGIIAFSSPFDETAVDFLESLNVPMYKIASMEIVDLPLINMVAQTGKPLIISVGTASLSEVSEAVDAARAGGCTDLTLLACTSSYPAVAEDANLARIPAMREIFGTKVGLSDHTLGIGVSVAATVMGATVLEKHVTIRRADGGVDSAFSMEPHEVSQLIDSCRDAAASIGHASNWTTSAETESLRLRPSLYITRDVVAGELVTPDNVRSVRPTGGLPPKEISKVMGRSFKTALAKGTPVDWDLLG